MFRLGPQLLLIPMLLVAAASGSGSSLGTARNALPATAEPARSGQLIGGEVYVEQRNEVATGTRDYESSTHIAIFVIFGRHFLM